MTKGRYGGNKIRYWMEKLLMGDTRWTEQEHGDKEASDVEEDEEVNMLDMETRLLKMTQGEATGEDEAAVWQIWAGGPA